MSTLFIRRAGESQSHEVSDDYPLPVEDLTPLPRLVSYANETLTIAATAVGFTAATHLSKAAVARCGPLESGQVRYWTNGAVPTSTAGHLLEVGDRMVIDDPTEIVNFLAIRTGGVSGSLPATYEERRQ